MHRTLALQRKGGRMVSTQNGMRRILKHLPPVKDYIEKAVETGVYRSSDEIEAAVRALREGNANGVEPRVVASRFRRDIVRGTMVQDYPPEYHILCQHPPIPDPPRVPKKFERRMMAKQPKHPTEKLVKKYLKRQEEVQRRHSMSSTEDYYQKLLGVQPPSDNYAMGQKSAALSQAYAFAMKQYEVMRTQDLSEKEALIQVEELLAEEKKQEGHTSRNITNTLREWSQTGGEGDPSPSADGATKDESSVASGLPSVFHEKPRVMKGMMQWSRMLRDSGIPYSEWTVGASTALDHWIARNILQLSEASWDALLEGNDPSLLSRGQDIVTIRETLFPETRLDVDERMMDQDLEDDPFSAKEEEPPIDSKGDEERSVDDLLRQLRGLDRGSSDTSKQSFSFDDDSTGWGSQDTRKDSIQILTEELQQWRAKNAKAPYDDWQEPEKQKFSTWLNKYLTVLTSDVDRPFVDLDETRRALLSSPPQTPDEADEFWQNLQDETKADIFLQQLLKDGPPESLSYIEKSFWTLPYDTQLERLVNLGTVRPLLDDYASEEDRKDFMRRYGDFLLDGVELDHLVEDPEGAITGMDCGIEAIRAWGIQKEDRFRLVKLPYNAGLSDKDESGDSDATSGQEAALERARALYYAWNQQKAGRARYEETMFVRGDLGLSYTSKSENQKAKDELDEYYKK